MGKIVEAEAHFKDTRGEIYNIVREPSQVSIIESCDGALRGGHVHQKHEHVEYVISGLVEVYWIDGEGVIIHEEATPGCKWFTPAGTAHGYRSIGASEILHVVLGPMSDGEYERDTKKVDLWKS